MGPLGISETIFIFVLALLIFGPKKLPELGRTVGKAMSEFRRASSELKATFDREMSGMEKEHESLKEVTRKYADDSHSYDPYYDAGDYGSQPAETEPYVPPQPAVANGQHPGGATPPTDETVASTLIPNSPDPTAEPAPAEPKADPPAVKA